MMENSSQLLENPITAVCWMGLDQKFFQPVREFVLLDCRNIHPKIITHFYTNEDLLHQHCPFIDGYIHKEDLTEFWNFRLKTDLTMNATIKRNWKWLLTSKYL